MRAEVFTNDGAVHEGEYEFPVLPAVGDVVSIDVGYGHTPLWTSWRVLGREINGYRGELPVRARVILRLGRL